MYYILSVCLLASATSKNSHKTRQYIHLKPRISCCVMFFKVWDIAFIRLSFMLLKLRKTAINSRVSHLPPQRTPWPPRWTARLLCCYTLPPSPRTGWEGERSRPCTYRWWSRPRSPSSPSTLACRWPGTPRCSRNLPRSGILPRRAEGVRKCVNLNRGFISNAIAVQYNIVYIHSDNIAANISICRGK